MPRSSDDSSGSRPHRRAVTIRHAIEIGVPAIALLAIAMMWLGSGGPTSERPDDPVIGTSVALGDAPVVGDNDAPIVGLVFSNFACALCVQFGHEVWPHLRRRWVETGEVQVVFRHFTSSTEPTAEAAVRLAGCLARHEQFWLVHDSVFRDQPVWNEAAFRRQAADAGIRLDGLNACVRYGGSDEQLREDRELAFSLELERAPMFVIGTREGDGQVRVRGLIYGAAPVEQFDKAFRLVSDNIASNHGDGSYNDASGGT